MTSATERHTCTCTACNGLSFTTPRGYVPQGADYATMVHNYARLAHGPAALARVFASRGVVAVGAVGPDKGRPASGLGSGGGSAVSNLAQLGD